MFTPRQDICSSRVASSLKINSWGILREKKGDKPLAPRARFELATLRLTAECSTIELPGNRIGRNEAYLEKCSEEDVGVSMKHGEFAIMQIANERRKMRANQKWKTTSRAAWKLFWVW